MKIHLFSWQNISSRSLLISSAMKFLVFSSSFSGIHRRCLQCPLHSSVTKAVKRKERKREIFHRWSFSFLPSSIFLSVLAMLMPISVIIKSIPKDIWYHPSKSERNVYANWKLSSVANGTDNKTYTHIVAFFPHVILKMGIEYRIYAMRRHIKKITYISSLRWWRERCKSLAEQKTQDDILPETAWRVRQNSFGCINSHHTFHDGRTFFYIFLSRFASLSAAHIHKLEIHWVISNSSPSTHKTHSAI